jgi:hypothetical protein
MSSDNSNAFLTEAANKPESKHIIENHSEDDIYSNKTQKLEDELDDEDEAVQDLRPISAVAPKILHQDELQVEVSSTPAFQSLEEVIFFYGKKQAFNY